MMLKRQEHEAAEAAEMLAKIREEEENLRRISEHTNTRDELRVSEKLVSLLFNAIYLRLWLGEFFSNVFYLITIFLCGRCSAYSLVVTHALN